METAIDLDKNIQRVWVLDIQYDKGALIRKEFDLYSEAVSRYRFARDRANTEWQKLFEVTVRTEWERVNP